MLIRRRLQRRFCHQIYPEAALVFHHFSLNEEGRRWTDLWSKVDGAAAAAAWLTTSSWPAARHSTNCKWSVQMLARQGICEECVRCWSDGVVPTQVLSPDLSGKASLFFIILAGRREDDGLTFDLEIDGATAATPWLTASPWLETWHAASDQYKCSLVKVFV
jgi:hypothetical protein